MSWHFEQKELEELYKEFSSESDIVLPVLAGSYIDKMMRELLLNKLSKGNTSKQLLTPGKGRLSEYQIKADLLYCLEIISKEIYQDITRIGEIRNKFAHSHEKLSFTTKQIVEEINKLKSPRDKHADRVSKLKSNPERTDFVLAVSSIIVKLNESLIGG